MLIQVCVGNFQSKMISINQFFFKESKYEQDDEKIHIFFIKNMKTQ